MNFRGLLPFMDPKQKKGEKAKSLKRQCSRVDMLHRSYTDAGFNRPPHKMDLAHHQPYTKVLKYFGIKSPKEKVQVEISRDGKKLTLD
ncbi:hypothetical protein OROGR_012757 [Orobanche gracilis]